MNIPKILKSASWVISGSIFACALGCSSTATTADKKARDTKSEEVGYVYTVGSNIPKKVRKVDLPQGYSVEGPDSPTLAQMEKKSMLDTQKLNHSGARR